MTGTATTKWVYTIIKSFTANGSVPCEQSYRAISRRAGVSDKTVKKNVQELLKNKWLEHLGGGTHLGGSYPILKVRTNTAIKFVASPQLSADSNSESAEFSAKSAESQARKSAITKETIKNNNFSKQKEQNPVQKEAEVAPEYADDIFADGNWGKGPNQ